MLLAIDIGNTQIHQFLFDGNQIVRKEKQGIKIFSGDSIKAWKNTITGCIISSVSEIPETLTEVLKHINVDPLIAHTELDFPFKISNTSIATLGIDRIAACAGGQFLHPHSVLFIIDAGSALTLDVFHPQEGMLGGNISPGMEMRFKALHTFTKRLPLLSPSDRYENLGNSTSESIISGVQRGMLAEIETYITEYKKQYPGIIALITGGDSGFFVKNLKNSIFVEPNLVAIGLKSIYDYNAE